MFRYIRIHHLFASIASKYSHKFSYKYLIFNLTQNKYLLKRYSLQSKYLLQHFLLLENIRFKIFVFKQTFTKLQAKFTCKYSHTSECLLPNICTQANICFVLLQIIYRKAFSKVSNIRIKTCFFRFKAKKYLLHVCLYSLRTEYSQCTLYCWIGWIGPRF
jgi:hypothetical protein